MVSRWANELVSLSPRFLIYKMELLIINKVRWPGLQSRPKRKDLNQLMRPERPPDVVWGPASLEEVQAHGSDDGVVMSPFEGSRVAGTRRRVPHASKRAHLGQGQTSGPGTVSEKGASPW